MKVKVTDTIRRRIFLAMIGAGVASPSAYVAANLTVDSEGMYTNVYKDPVGLNTLCIGHLARKGEILKSQYSEDECIKIFTNDWIEHEKQLNSVVKVKWRSDWMKGAATDFTFHMGITKVKSSTFLKDLNAGRYDAACEQLTRWVYGNEGGVMKRMPGLVIRASKRYDLCMNGEPAGYKPSLERWKE